MMSVTPRAKTVLAWIFLAGFSLALAMSAQAQTNAATPATGAPPAAVATEAAPLDYAAWDTLSKQAETLIGDAAAPSTSLDQMRVVIAGMRERFLAAQNTNSARIATIRTQIESLGTAPATVTPKPMASFARSTASCASARPSN